MLRHNNNSAEKSDLYSFDSPSLGSESRRSGSSKKKWWIIGGVLGAIVVLGAVLGGVLGTQLNKSEDSKSSGSSSDTSGTSNDAASSNSSSSSVASNTSVTPLTTWDWTKASYYGANAQYSSASSSGKKSVQGPMVGVALGNWLVLEQWMDEQWFNASAGYNASIVDEWGLMQYLGDDAEAVMKEHYSTYVTEDDIATLAAAGINHLRIPLGYWTFVPTISGEPYLTDIQKPYLTNVLSWAYKHKMYVLLEMHGMPGSQNGEITSGHKTTDPKFFDSAYLSRAEDTVKAALQWISESPYRSVVSAFGVVNEPRPYTQAQLDSLQSLYQMAYDTSMALDDPVPIQFHHGYPNSVITNASETGYWTDFVSNKTKGMIMLEAHPYPGTFPLQSDGDDILSQVCSTATRYSTFPAPVIITEWSIRTNLSSATFEREFYTQQLTAWSYTGGASFWSLKATNGSQNYGNSIQYSFLDLMNKGSIPLPSTNETTMAFLQSLGSPCGTIPQMSWAS